MVTLLDLHDFQEKFGSIPVRAAYIEKGFVWWKGWKPNCGTLNVAVQYPRDGRYVSLGTQRGLLMHGVIVSAEAWLGGDQYALKIGDVIDD